MVSKVSEKWTKEPIYKYITTSDYDYSVGSNLTNKNDIGSVWL